MELWISLVRSLNMRGMSVNVARLASPIVFASCDLVAIFLIRPANSVQQSTIDNFSRLLLILSIEHHSYEAWQHVAQRQMLLVKQNPTYMCDICLMHHC